MPRPGLSPALGLGFALALSACGGVQVRGGIPVLPKVEDGSLVAGAAFLPDIDRGKQARIAGRLDIAERNLLPLAKRGYPDAQVLLAETYSARDSLDGEDAAIKWFRAALAKRPEADIGLARVLMRRDDRSAAAEAMRLIADAKATRDEPAADAARLDLYSRYPDFDTVGESPQLAERLAQSALPQDRLSALAWYRANVVDGDNGRKLTRLCAQSAEIDLQCAVDAAHQLRYGDEKAALQKHIDATLAQFEKNAGQVGETGVQRQEIDYAFHAGALARAMVDQPEGTDAASAYQAFEAATGNTADAELPPDVQQIIELARRENDQVVAAPTANAATPALTIYPELADRVLRWMLKRGGDYAVEACGVAVEFPYLLRDVDVVSQLDRGVAAGRYHANLYLGEMYQFGSRAPLDPEKAEKYLQASLVYRSTLTIGHYRLGRLYQRGFLGKPAPQKAVENLLAAARNGAPAGYSGLAELFFSSHGLKINRVNAYVFARRAEDGGRPLMLRSRQITRDTGTKKNTAGGATTIATEVVTYNVLDRLKTEMTPSELAQGEALYQAERAQRPAVRPPITIDVWKRSRL